MGFENDVFPKIGVVFLLSCYLRHEDAECYWPCKGYFFFFLAESQPPFSVAPADVLSVILEPFQVPSLRLRMFNISCTQQATLAWHRAKDSNGCSPQARWCLSPSPNLSNAWGQLGKQGQSPGRGATAALLACMQDDLLCASLQSSTGREIVLLTPLLAGATSAHGRQVRHLHGHKFLTCWTVTLLLL